MLFIFQYFQISRCLSWKVLFNCCDRRPITKFFPEVDRGHKVSKKLLQPHSSWKSWVHALPFCFCCLDKQLSFSKKRYFSFSKNNFEQIFSSLKTRYHRACWALCIVLHSLTEFVKSLYFCIVLQFLTELAEIFNMSLFRNSAHIPSAS